MRLHFALLFACACCTAMRLPTGDVTEIRDKISLLVTTFNGFASASPQEGSEWRAAQDHAGTPDDRSGDFGGSHGNSRLYYVVAFIFCVLAIFTLYERYQVQHSHAIPVGYSIIAFGLVVIGTFSLFRVPGMGAADHAGTPDDRSGEEPGGGISLFGCHTHHVWEFILSIVILLLLLFTIAGLFLNNHGSGAPTAPQQKWDKYRMWSNAGATLLMVIVAIMLLY
jgi:hypothetical protein